MGASYEKVVKRIQETNACKSLIEKARHRLSTLRVEEMTGGITYEGKPFLKFKVVSGTGDSAIIRSYEHRNAEFNIWGFTDMAYTRDEMRAVVKETFGVPVNQFSKRMVVPTYFCKIDKVHDEFQNSFGDLARQELGNLGNESIGRIVTECRERILSTEAAQVLESTSDRYTIEEIKKTLLRFKDSKPEILKQALDEFVVHALTED